MLEIFFRHLFEKAMQALQPNMATSTVVFTSLIQLVFLLTVFLLLIWQFFLFHSGTNHSHGIANHSLISRISCRFGVYR